MNIILHSIYSTYHSFLWRISLSSRFTINLEIYAGFAVIVYECFLVFPFPRPPVFNFNVIVTGMLIRNAFARMLRPLPSIFFNWG